MWHLIIPYSPPYGAVRSAAYVHVLLDKTMNMGEHVSSKKFRENGVCNWISPQFSCRPLDSIGIIIATMCEYPTIKV